MLRETVEICHGTGARNSLIPLFHHLDTTRRVLEYYRPDFIHFCDTLTDSNGRALALSPFLELQQKIREEFPEVRIIRSIPIPREGAAPEFPCLELAKELEPVSDFFLTDTWLGKEPVEGYIGITGEVVDRSLARSLARKSRIPVILAGGLSPENVCQTLLDVRAAGADSCTRTNRVDEGGTPIRFQKDFARVGKFVEETRKAEKVLKDEKATLLARLDKLKEDLEDREKALPAHSVRPHQIMVIEELEEEIQSLEKDLLDYREA